MNGLLLARCVAELGALLEQFPWEEKRVYADWLAQTYYYVRHTTRLQAVAAARFGFDAHGDMQHQRFLAHAGEEKRHEQLPLDDLRALGLEVADFPERPSTRMFYEPQYFKIEHIHPLVHFGYLLPLEALGPQHGHRVIARVTAAHGPTTVSFLRVHADEDVGHLEKAFQMVAGLPDEQKRAIGLNIEQTTLGYRTMLLEIEAGARAVAR
jgi:hypothetical protein